MGFGLFFRCCNLTNSSYFVTSCPLLLTLSPLARLPGLFNYLVISGSRYPLLFHLLSLAYLIYILHFFCGFNKLLLLLYCLVIYSTLYAV